MVRVLTLNLWGYANPYDYTVRRGITRGAAPDSPAATRVAPAGSSWPIRRALIADLLRAERPDVAGLQEVASDPAVDGGRNAAAQLTGPLGWHLLYAEGDGPPLPDGRVDGLAVISPHPLREIARLPLPDADGRETYLCLAAEATTPEGPLAFLTTHLALAGSVTHERAARDESVRRILAFCRSLPPTTPVVLTGDLNSVPALRPVRCLTGEVEIGGERGAFRDAGTAITGAAIATMPSHGPVVAIDYVLALNADVTDCRAAGTPDAAGYYPSDHLGLIADLHLRNADTF
jgi:endonuclease/exonuclease/phosphatase family metal-dependent hydrolase